MSARPVHRLLGRYLRLSWRPLRSMIPRVTGFGLSVIILGVASLVSIPAMIAASGEAVWASIALGQVIGTIGAVAVGYGWGWFGPARIAQYDATDRRVEYLESLATRSVLVLPVSTCAAVIAYFLATTAPMFSAAGAVAMTIMGLSANWYFVGLSKPFTMLAWDTVPRAVGTVVGVLLMYAGHSAIMGPLGMFFGMIAALALSTVWVVRETRSAGAAAHELRRIRTVLAQNRHGIASALGAAASNAAPLAIVSVVAPSIQPAFALVDRVRGLIVVSSAPAVTILQGWVPRGSSEGARLRRANVALVCASLGAIFLGAGTAVVAHSLLTWLGNRQIEVSRGVVLLMSACVAFSLFQAVLERVALATFERLRVSVIAVVVASLIGLPLVGAAGQLIGTEGALAGVLVGLLVGVTIEFVAYLRIKPVERVGGRRVRSAAP